MKELRFYVVDIDLVKTFLVIGSEEFKQEAEKQGTVYTKEKFAEAFNAGNVNSISDSIFIEEVDINGVGILEYKGFKIPPPVRNVSRFKVDCGTLGGISCEGVDCNECIYDWKNANVKREWVNGVSR